MTALTPRQQVDEHLEAAAKHIAAAFTLSPMWDQHERKRVTDMHRWVGHLRRSNSNKAWRA